MSLLNFHSWQSPEPPQQNSSPVTGSFAAAIAAVKPLVWQTFDREISQKQLYYHTQDHVKGVQHRAELIFQAIRPYWQATLAPEIAPVYLERMQLLLDLCAISHDMLQIFAPVTEPHTARKREAGVSEMATIETLLKYISSLNQLSTEPAAENSDQFTEADLLIIREAIAATICAYDPVEQAIYQPALYNTDPPISPVARILALADIGALGIEGIEAYNQEGRLLFLEENLDVIPILIQGIAPFVSNDFNLSENIRQRLLKRARFQVSFAKSRLIRHAQELASFPTAALPVLTEVFPHVNQETIREIERMTPTAEATSLETLMEFFQLDRLISAER